MPLIPQQIKTERAHLQIRMDVNVVADLESYCRFIESSRDFVVENALQFVFKKDRDFQDWLTANRTAGAIAGLSPNASPNASADASSGASPDATRDTAPGTSNSGQSGQRHEATRKEPKIEAQ